ncbi:MAG TPA: asparagine synthase-related protein, partial [Bryobacteraceae bacterium]|nr:asparagine synthase-related protein [Bryobacteraceae bacterium]
GILDVQGGDFALRASCLEYFWAGRANLASLRTLLGYEPRDPLGDLRLVEFCLSLPPEQYMRDGVQRRFARRVLSDRLPAEVLSAKRRAPQCPEWFHRLSYRRELILEDLASLKNSPLASRYIDLQRLQRIASDWPADADAAEGRFSDLVLTLLRGYEIGRLLRWVETGQRASAAQAPLSHTPDCMQLETRV